MFCYTTITDIRCVLRELDLWTQISKEHPVFIKTVAELTDKDLSKEIIKQLDEVQKKFEHLHRAVRDACCRLGYGGAGWRVCPPMSGIRNLVEAFLRYNCDFLNVLKCVKTYGEEDKVWQALIGHIINEQEYMHQLFRMLRSQLAFWGAPYF